MAMIAAETPDSSMIPFFDQCGADPADIDIHRADRPAPTTMPPDAALSAIVSEIADAYAIQRVVGLRQWQRPRQIGIRSG